MNILQRAILNFYAHNLISEAEEKRLRVVFEEVDENGDGMIDKEELKKILAGDPKINKGKKNKSKTSIDSGRETPKLLKAEKKEYAKNLRRSKRIFKIMDSENTKMISYKEFIRAMFNKKQMGDPENIKKCFEALDRNDNFLISLDEIKEVTDFQEPNIEEQEEEVKKIFLGYSKGKNSVRITR